MLTNPVKAALDADRLCDRESFLPFPKLADRAFWNGINAEARAYYTGSAPRWLDRDYPVLPAMRYMDFVRNGNRSRFEKSYFDRRRALQTLLFSECLSDSGETLETVINLVWAICEESSWVLPAHNNQYAHSRFSSPRALPDVEADAQYIDLFSAETASLLAWVWYFLKEKLDAYSPMISRRIEYEVDRRVLSPFLALDDMGWMGLDHDRPVNNWNPWINSNVLAASLVMEGDMERRRATVLKVAQSCDRFLSFYAPDGGCDEGPGYFNVAGASIMDTLELLDVATVGAAVIWSEPLIHNMASYIMYVHISGRYHINFADAGALTQPNALLLRRVAFKTGLDDLRVYAEGALHEGFSAIPYPSDYPCVYRRMRDMVDYRPEEYSKAPLVEPLSHVFEGIQVAMARENADSSGLYFAAKGGHNNESHNHNDVGNYIVYLDGEPAIVDAGVETYSAKTFSAERYQIWTMQSRYHNTAIIGACDQHAGREFHAEDFSFSDDGALARFRVNMAGAYDGYAHLDSYVREITLNRDTCEILLRDSFEMNLPAPIALPILCAAEPRHAPGEMQIPVGRRVMRLGFDEALFDVSVREIPIPDASLQRNWRRPCLYRILLTRKNATANGTHTLRIRA